MGIYAEEHEIFRTVFRKFVEKKIAPHLGEWEEKKEVPRDMWKLMGEQGYLCPWVSEKYGGTETDFLFSVIIIEELARVDAPNGIGLHNDVVAPYINSFGSEEQKARWLPRCVEGKIILAIAMTEPGTGSDLQAIKTTAVKDGNEYVINGQKAFITNGSIADLVVVVCKTDTHADPPRRGIALICVEDGTPGFAKGKRLQKMGQHSQDTAELFFEDCRVPISNLLGQEGKGFSYLMQKLQQERLVATLGSQVLAERIFEDTLQYSKDRQAFGQPIGKFQHNAFKLAEMATEIELGRTFIDSLTVDHVAKKDIVTKVSMAKWWIAEMVNRVAYQCLQLYGGYGYMEEYPICRRYQDARVHTIYGGTSEIMKLIISRQLGL